MLSASAFVRAYRVKVKSRPRKGGGWVCVASWPSSSCLVVRRSRCAAVEAAVQQAALLLVGRLVG